MLLHQRETSGGGAFNAGATCDEQTLSTRFERSQKMMKHEITNKNVRSPFVQEKDQPGDQAFGYIADSARRLTCGGEGEASQLQNLQRLKTWTFSYGWWRKWWR